MERFKKILLIAYVVILIGHIILYFMKEESLISFILGVTAMVLMILGILVSKRKEQ